MWGIWKKVFVKNTEIERNNLCPGPCGSVGWRLVHTLKGCEFDSWSGHIPRLWVRSPVRLHARGSWLMSPAPSLFASPPYLLPLSLKAMKKMSLVRIKRNHLRSCEGGQGRAFAYCSVMGKPSSSPGRQGGWSELCSQRVVCFSAWGSDGRWAAKRLQCAVLLLCPEPSGR